MNFIKLHYRILNSYFYRFVLTSTDKVVLQTLFSLVLHDRKYYQKGLLIVNAKQKTIAELAGIPLRSINRSLSKLSKLGIIIRLPQAKHNSRYFIGFRTELNDRMYLIHYHIREYDKLLGRVVDTLEDINTAKINLKQMNLVMDKHLVKFIQNNITNPTKLLRHKIDNKKTIYELIIGDELSEKYPIFKTNFKF